VKRGALTAGHLGERSRHQLFYKMVQEISMPPAIRKNVEYQLLFSLEPLAERLEEKERQHLYRPERLETLLQHIPLGLGKDEGPVAESKQEVLTYLKKSKLISAAEYDLAREQLERVEKEAKKQFEGMLDDYQGQLMQWLKGEQPACLKLF
jgi:hypothetical protein